MWRRISSSPRELGRLIAAHPAFAAVIAVGAVMRVLMMVAYPPALFFGDSWDYIVAAFSGHPLAIAAARPSGYGWLIRLLTLPGRDFVQLVTVQHLAGLVVGTLIYVVLVRARVARTIAAAAAALVLLDGYVITLEQYAMPEALWTLTLLVSMLVLVWPALAVDAAAVSSSPAEGSPTAAGRLSVRRLGLVGLLLAAATLQRETALFTVPLFAIYALWARAGLRGCCAFVVAFAVPVLAYAARFEDRYGPFALDHTSGWTLYGRVAGFADCAGAGIAPAARPLCETAAQRRSHPDAPDWYIFAAGSPAVRRYGALGSLTPSIDSDSIVGGFARRIILHQPLAYLDAAASDLLRYFTPGATAFDDSISATSLPAKTSAEDIVQVVRDRYLPSLRPRVRAPSSVVRAYRRIVHVPRPILALLLVASLLALALRTPSRRVVLLLSGGGLALIVGTAATGGFGIRYMLPTVPLFALGGTLAARDLAARLSGRPEWSAARRAVRRWAPSRARPELG